MDAVCYSQKRQNVWFSNKGRYYLHQRPCFYLGLNMFVGGGVNIDLIKYECGSGAWPGIL